MKTLFMLVLGLLLFVPFAHGQVAVEEDPTAPPETRKARALRKQKMKAPAKVKIVPRTPSRTLLGRPGEIMAEPFDSPSISPPMNNALRMRAYQYRYRKNQHR